MRYYVCTTEAEEEYIFKSLRKLSRDELVDKVTELEGSGDDYRKYTWALLRVKEFRSSEIEEIK